MNTFDDLWDALCREYPELMEAVAQDYLNMLKNASCDECEFQDNELVCEKCREHHEEKGWWELYSPKEWNEVEAQDGQRT